MRKLPSATWLITLAVLGVSVGSVFIRLADWPPLAAAFVRCLVGALFMSLLVERVALPAKTWRRIALPGLMLGLHLGVWIASLALTSVAMSVLLVNTAPIWILIFGYASGERPTGRDIFAVTLAFAGMAWMSSNSSQAGSHLLGNGLAVLGAITYALYVLAARGAAKDFPPLRYVRGVYGYAAAALLIPAVFMVDINSPKLLTGLGWILALCVASQIIGHTCIQLAARKMSGARVATVLLLEPVIASLLAWQVLGEVPPAALAIGAPLILAGALLAVYRR